MKYKVVNRNPASNKHNEDLADIFPLNAPFRKLNIYILLKSVDLTFIFYSDKNASFKIEQTGGKFDISFLC